MRTPRGFIILFMSFMLAVSSAAAAESRKILKERCVVDKDKIWALLFYRSNGELRKKIKLPFTSAKLKRSPAEAGAPWRRRLEADGCNSNEYAYLFTIDVAGHDTELVASSCTLHVYNHTGRLLWEKYFEIPLEEQLGFEEAVSKNDKTVWVLTAQKIVKVWDYTGMLINEFRLDDKVYFIHDIYLSTTGMYACIVHEKAGLQPGRRFTFYDAKSGKTHDPQDVDKNGDSCRIDDDGIGGILATTFNDKTRAVSERIVYSYRFQ